MGGQQHPAENGKQHKAVKTKERAGRQVGFAPGPLAEKYRTDDGHPDHEGIVARPKRSLGLSWGHDLTPSSIKDLEEQLGEECRPSLDRLKRRVGLLPLRKRPKEFLTWMLDEEEEEEGPKGKRAKGLPRKRKQPSEPAAGSAAAAGAVGGAAGGPLEDGSAAPAAAAAATDGAAGPLEADEGADPGRKKRGSKKLQPAAPAAAAREGGGEPGPSAAAGTARAKQTLGGRKPRLKAAVPAGRLVPPINKMSAGLQWPQSHKLGAIPSLPTTVGGSSLGSALAADLPAITVTFNRKAGSRQHAALGSSGSSEVPPLIMPGGHAGEARAGLGSATAAGAVNLGGPSALLPGAAGPAALPGTAAGVAGGGVLGAAGPKKKSRRLGSVADPLGSALGRGVLRGTMR